MSPTKLPATGLQECLDALQSGIVEMNRHRQRAITDFAKECITEVTERLNDDVQSILELLRSQTVRMPA